MDQGATNPFGRVSSHAACEGLRMSLHLPLERVSPLTGLSAVLLMSALGLYAWAMIRTFWPRRPTARSAPGIRPGRSIVPPVTPPPPSPSPPWPARSPPFLPPRALRRQGVERKRGPRPAASATGFLDRSLENLHAPAVDLGWRSRLSGARTQRRDLFVTHRLTRFDATSAARRMRAAVVGGLGMTISTTTMTMLSGAGMD
jgi:hypothetical protein